MERQERSSIIAASNRLVEERLPRFEKPVLAASALLRFAHSARQVLIARGR